MNIKKKVYYPYVGIWYSLTSRYPIGTNIYSKE